MALHLRVVDPIALILADRTDRVPDTIGVPQFPVGR
jgi:hypothetical protein